MWWVIGASNGFPPALGPAGRLHGFLQDSGKELMFFVFPEANLFPRGIQVLGKNTVPLSREPFKVPVLLFLREAGVMLDAVTESADDIERIEASSCLFLARGHLQGVHDKGRADPRHALIIFPPFHPKLRHVDRIFSSSVILRL